MWIKAFVNNFGIKPVDYTPISSSSSIFFMKNVQVSSLSWVQLCHALPRDTAGAYGFRVLRAISAFITYSAPATASKDDNANIPLFLWTSKVPEHELEGYTHS